MRRTIPPRAAAGLMVGAVAAALALASCAQSPPIQIPPADAAPETVVQTLIAAINARDADAVRAVSTPAFAEQVTDTWGYFLTRQDTGSRWLVSDQGVG